MAEVEVLLEQWSQGCAADRCDSETDFDAGQDGKGGCLLEELDTEPDSKDVDVSNAYNRADTTDDSEQKNCDDTDARLTGHLGGAYDEDRNDGKDPIGNRVLRIR